MGTKLCPGQLEITDIDLVLYQKVINFMIGQCLNQ
jgi:hypothetical protein